MANRRNQFNSMELQQYDSFLSQKEFEMRRYNRLDSMEMANLLLLDFYTYLHRVARKNLHYYSFVATFNQELDSDGHFQKLLQCLLQNLETLDKKEFNKDYSETGETLNQNSCSLAGQLFYISTFHPKHKKANRRLHKTIIVFNPLQKIFNTNRALA